MSTFVDVVEIEVQSGAGGPGCISFRREKYVPKGGPDGGDGGKGGSVYLQVDGNLNTLMDLDYRKEYKASAGETGSGGNKTGEAGRDVTIRVPPGTMAYNSDTGELICDLVREGEVFLVAPGGKGGRGNTHFKSSTNQAPRRADAGMPGITLRLRLELKLIADVGLVGFPNAGKSSLLRALSRARPKVAEYPFTTLTPNIGSVEIGEYRTIKMADIPGIIDGASRGRGLGLTFLRHIERTTLLLFLLDGAKSDFLEDLQILKDELKNYNWRLLAKPSLVCINKIDLWDAPTLEEWKHRLGEEYLFISAKEKVGLADLSRALTRIWNARGEEHA